MNKSHITKVHNRKYKKIYRNITFESNNELKVSELISRISNAKESYQYRYSVISDQQYDMLVAELKTLISENEFIELQNFYLTSKPIV